MENAEVTNSRAAMVSPEKRGRGGSPSAWESLSPLPPQAARPPPPPDLGTSYALSSSPSPPSPKQLGFFGILLVEAVTGKGIFEMAGLKVGQGLGFEF